MNESHQNFGGRRFVGRSVFLRSSLFLAGAVLTGTLFFAAPPVFGAERYSDFYQALLQRGYYDTAVDYLESLRGKPNIPAEIADQLDFLIGKATLSMIRDASAAERPIYVNRCRELIERFLKEHPDHPQAQEAGTALARIWLEDGRANLDRINPSLSEAEQLPLRETARKNFEKAAPLLEKAVAQARARAKSVQDKPDAQNDPATAQIYADFLGVLLESASLTAQTARTYPAGSEAYTKGLEAAKAKYDELYVKYQMYPAGCRARFEEAVIEQELGHIDQAKEMLAEIFSLPMQPSLYGLKTDAILLFDRISINDKKPDGWMEMLRQYNTWINAPSIPSRYTDSADGLEIHLLTGRAALALYELRRNDQKEFAEAGKRVFTDTSDPTLKLFKKLDDLAYEMFDYVYQRRSLQSLEAEKLLKNPIFSERREKTYAEKPADFTAALQNVNRSWTDFVQANLDAGDAVGTEEIQKAGERKTKAADAADRNFRWVFDLAPRSADPNTLDDLRLQWATLKLLTGRFEEAEILADYLLYHRPSYQNATKADEISLHALKSIFQAEQDKGVDKEHLAPLEARVAEKTGYIMKRWGENVTGDALPIVQEATLVLMETAISAGEIDKAKEFLAKIPAESAQRAGAEMALGQSLWAAYIRQSSADEASRPSPDALASLIDSARESLRKGLDAKRSAAGGFRSDDRTTVYAALSLAQIYMTDGNPKEAFEWLRHPVIGPLTLVEKGLKSDESSEEGSSGGGFSEQFRLTALTLSLRVLVGINDFARAEEVTGELESFIERASPENRERLTGVYLSLGKELEAQIRRLREESINDPSKAEELKSVSQGFEGFLERISGRTEGNTYYTLRWVGDTFYSLGIGLRGESAELSPEAKAYFEKSGRTYLAILKQIKADPAWAPNEKASALATVRLADCLRQVGKCGAALNYLIPLLKENESNLELQFSAARVYQEWGNADKTYFVRAIQGGEPQENAKNLIWGWNRIITILSRNIDQAGPYRDRFYEAVLNKMECRKRWTQTLTDPAARKKQAVSAENELVRLHQVHPDLGGPATFAKLEAYLTEFRAFAGTNNPNGLTKEK